MLRALPVFLCIVSTHIAVAQLSVDSIPEADVRRMVNYLASDSLKGRGDYRSELHIAGHYIEQEFIHSGLKSIGSSYLQPFTSKDFKPNERLQDTAGNYYPDKVLFNVIGMLPGKSLPGEIVLFSAHYDHIGVQQNSGSDSIFNGANDNASGTVGLLALASYFSKRADNARTLLFCAFAGEELGLFGSRYFVQRFSTKAIKVVINIEMIGRSTVGNQSVFITGAGRSTFASIFRKHTKDSLKIRKEPAVEKQLFMRSDNYPFALQGIPAHTIMCSDDSDPYYHNASDEASYVNIKNMTTVIRAIARGCQSIIDGTDTPKLYR